MNFEEAKLKARRKEELPNVKQPAERRSESVLGPSQHIQGGKNVVHDFKCQNILFEVAIMLRQNENAPVKWRFREQVFDQIILRTTVKSADCAFRQKENFRSLARGILQITE